MASILVIEDTENNRIIIERRLVSKGHVPTLCVTAEDGIEKAKELLPDLILTDIGLPGIDGWEATRRLKADEKTGHIPIIALTAHAVAGDREKALAAGCDDYETKPIAYKSLFAKINALLEKNESSAQTSTEPEQPAATVEAEKPAADESVLIPQRVRIAKHNLRNPLGEIFGFAEILAEEADDAGHGEMVVEFRKLAASTTAQIKDLNQCLSAEALNDRPDAAPELANLLAQFSGRINGAVKELIGRCERLEGGPYIDDLARISDAADRLAQRAPALLASMFASPDLMAEEDDDSSDQTVFFFRPTDGGEGEESAPDMPESATRGDLNGTVLVVDDNEPNRELLTRRLSREGCTVAVAKDGERAMEMVRNHSFDIILLDMIMPKMNGYEVLRALKEDPELQHIPVIMISGLDDVETLVTCIEGGADDFLTKPFDPVLLRARLGACLEKKELRDREREHLAVIDEQRRRADELLHVILPHSIAMELKENNVVKPRQHPNVAVLFSDVTGFTSYCDKHAPETVMENLQTLVARFEEISERHGLEKIKTIGDAFMATAGLLDDSSNPSLQCVQAGLEMCAATNELPSGWKVHVGVHVGPVIAGVVGKRKYHFDVWGDTVNTASRVTDLAGDDGLVLSEQAWRDVADQCEGSTAGRFQVKGKGEMEVYRVTRVAP